MFTALGFIQVITGFIVQDRLGLDARMTGILTGAALFAAGIGLVLAQAVIVPRSGWTAPTLLKVGAPIAVIGFAGYTIDAGPVLLFAALVVMGLGLGVAMPGYTAGPTLLVRRDEQGGLAGLTDGDHRTHLRGRPHSQHGAVRGLAPAADHHRRGHHGDRRRVRPHPPTLPAHARPTRRRQHRRLTEAAVPRTCTSLTGSAGLQCVME